MTEPIMTPIIAPNIAPVPLPAKNPWVSHVAAAIPAPAPAPTAPPMRVLRKRSLFSLSVTLRTSCLWIVCSAVTSCREIAVAETFKNVPECSFEFISSTQIFCPATSVLRFSQDPWLDWAHEAQGIARTQIRDKSFRMSAFHLSVLIGLRCQETLHVVNHFVAGQ